MKNQRAVSMISLVITIVLIVIIASVSAYYITSTIEDAQYKDMKEEVKNVENVVEYAKTQILINEFTPNEEEYLISYEDLIDNFSRLLTAEELEYIKQVNESDVKAPYKYYLMDQEAFDKEFGNSFNVNNLREESKYLINYMDTTVVCNYGGIVYANKNVVPSIDEGKGEVQIVYTPNGNVTWKTAQEAMVKVSENEFVEILEMKYLWSQSYTEPIVDDFENVLTDGQTISLSNETGNDWYLWVCVKYKENEREKTYITKSEPFYIDNTPPTGVLEVENVEI